MGVVERCEKELKACKSYCQFLATTLYSGRGERFRYYLRCVKNLCQPQYEKCIDRSPLGRILKVMWNGA